MDQAPERRPYNLQEGPSAWSADSYCSDRQRRGRRDNSYHQKARDL